MARVVSANSRARSEMVNVAESARGDIAAQAPDYGRRKWGQDTIKAAASRLSRAGRALPSLGKVGAIAGLLTEADGSMRMLRRTIPPGRGAQSAPRHEHLRRAHLRRRRPRQPAAHALAGASAAGQHARGRARSEMAAHALAVRARPHQSLVAGGGQGL